MNAQQILESKGYDNSEINDLINYGTSVSPDGLDMKVREEFGLDSEPLHLWESYYRGDANETVLEQKAAEYNTDIDGLLRLMDIRLNELCHAVPEKTFEKS